MAITRSRLEPRGLSRPRVGSLHDHRQLWVDSDPAIGAARRHMLNLDHDVRDCRHLDTAGEFQMTVAQCVFVGLTLMLVAGCVVREEDGGRGYYRDRGDFHEDGHGGEHERNNFQR